MAEDVLRATRPKEVAVTVGRGAKSPAKPPAKSPVRPAARPPPLDLSTRDKGGAVVATDMATSPMGLPSPARPVERGYTRTRRRYTNDDAPALARTLEVS